MLYDFDYYRPSYYRPPYYTSYTVRLALKGDRFEINDSRNNFTNPMCHIQIKYYFTGRIVGMVKISYL